MKNTYRHHPLPNSRENSVITAHTVRLCINPNTSCTELCLLCFMLCFYLYVCIVHLASDKVFN